MGNLFKIIEGGLLDADSMSDINLKADAKGMHSFLMRLPADWDFSIAGLATRFADSPAVIGRILDDLTANKYFLKVQDVSSAGHFAGFSYYVFQTKELFDEFVQKLPKTIQKRLKTGAKSVKKTVSGKPVNGKPENGKSVNGKTGNGKLQAINSTFNTTYTTHAREENFEPISEHDNNTQSEFSKSDTHDQHDASPSPLPVEASTEKLTPGQNFEKNNDADPAAKNIEAAKQWAIENKDTILQWKSRANYSDSIAKNNEIEIFFRHWMSEKGEAHQVHLDPLRFFQLRFMSWLMSSKNNDHNKAEAKAAADAKAKALANKPRTWAPQQNSDPLPPYYRKS